MTGVLCGAVANTRCCLGHWVRISPQKTNLAHDFDFPGFVGSEFSELELLLGLDIVSQVCFKRKY